MERDDHELEQLRVRLAALTKAARKNDEVWRRAQAREMELLEADGLVTLLERLTEGLRSSYRLDTVTLVLVDPDHEIRQLLASLGWSREVPGVIFVASMHGLAPMIGSGRRPWLGPFSRADHGRLFPELTLESVALLSLVRQGQMLGSLNLGSRTRGRFRAALGTEFLHHLAVIAAFCIESAVNRGRLVRSGFTDALTGWHNRRYLQSRLREELSRCRREHAPLTCLMIDVDHFKSVNDHHGHLAGDEVLRQLARRIGTEVRGSDISARYGGEEFVILLPRTGIAAGYLLAERIRTAVATEPFELHAGSLRLPVTVSIGVAEHAPVPGDEDLKAAGERLVTLARRRSVPGQGTRPKCGGEGCEQLSKSQLEAVLFGTHSAM